MTADPQGFNYLGTIDDVAVRFPWRFKLRESRLHHSLMTQVIDGRPILLNDGYLVQHALARAALLKEDSLLWQLMRVGYVRVMARGGSAYGLAEMPERMSSIESFRNLVTDQVPDVRWKELRPRLEEVDRILRDRGHLLAWPPFESGSGFLAFARRLLETGATLHALGMGRAVRPAVLTDFLKRFIAEVQADPVGPRDKWEKVARTMAGRRGLSDDPVQFLTVLMNLATETYHYNMGIMLAAHHRVPVSVETQTSAAFDDLLVRPEVLVEEVDLFPRLHVPSALQAVDAYRLASIVADRDSRTYRARSEWMALRDAWERRHGTDGAAALSPEQRRALIREVRDSGEAYARALAGLVGRQVKYEHGEGLFNALLGAAVKEGGRTLATAVGLGAGAIAAASGGLPPAVGAALGGAAGYVVSIGQKKALSGVVRKFKVKLFEKQVLPPERVQQSLRAIRRIKARQVPSAIDINPAAVGDIVRQLKPFTPKG